MQGILSHKKMKDLPAEEPIPVTATEVPAEAAASPDSAENLPSDQEEAAEQSAQDDPKN